MGFNFIGVYCDKQEVKYEILFDLKGTIFIYFMKNKTVADIQIFIFHF